MINVTKTFLPPQEEYNAILKEAWDNAWITNRGALIQKLEHDLKAFLKIKNIISTTNGTLPLQIAIKALELTGEIITTPFSYVATTSAIVWENCTPVFVDIHPTFLTIDESKIEEKITSKTTAILATHVFGNPCNIEAIERIAKKHNLKVIYDAAHCFAVEYNNKSIFEYGDVSTTSFHATKLFHTGEGGALFCNDEELFHKLYYHHNFGHNGPEAFHGLGLNAKISELQAAMGLTVLPYMPAVITARSKIVAQYKKELTGLPLQMMEIRQNTKWNSSYFPVIFETEEALLKVKEALNKEDIFPRRYFYPSLNTIEYVKGQNCGNSESISTRIACLPLYYGLESENISKITSLIKTHLTT